MGWSKIPNTVPVEQLIHIEKVFNFARLELVVFQYSSFPWRQFPHCSAGLLLIDNLAFLDDDNGQQNYLKAKIKKCRLMTLFIIKD
jgi:hypothetical protein